MENKKPLTQDAVKLELDRLILQNGKATTLEIKNSLRGLGYWATQNDVHNSIEQIYLDNPGKYHREPQSTAGNEYNVYSATSEWEQTVASKQTPTKLSDFETKTGSIAPVSTTPVTQKPEKNELNKSFTKSLDDVINEVNDKTPLHIFHDSIRESKMTGNKIVAEYTPGTGKLKTINDLNKGTEYEVKDNQPVSTDIANNIAVIIVDKLGLDPSEITRTARFTNDLGCDSLDAVELLMEFEKEFNIAIPDEDAEKINTVGDAIDYVENAVKSSKTSNFKSAASSPASSAATPTSDDIREPLQIFYTMDDFEKFRSAGNNYDPKNWVCHQRYNSNTEIHVYNKAVTRDQARSRFASKHKIKSAEVRCSTAERFNLQEA